MNRVLIIPNTLKDPNLEVTGRVVNKLAELEITPLISKAFSDSVANGAEYFAEFFIIQFFRLPKFYF